MSSSLDVDPHQRDVEFLDKYAMDRWESVLQFLVQPGRGQTAISRDAMRTLLHAGLIERFILSHFLYIRSGNSLAFRNMVKRGLQSLLSVSVDFPVRGKQEMFHTHIYPHTIFSFSQCHASMTRAHAFNKQHVYIHKQHLNSWWFS